MKRPLSGITVTRGSRQGQSVPEKSFQQRPEVRGEAGPGGKGRERCRPGARPAVCEAGKQKCAPRTRAAEVRAGQVEAATRQSRAARGLVGYHKSELNFTPMDGQRRCSSAGGHPHLACDEGRLGCCVDGSRGQEKWGGRYKRKRLPLRRWQGKWGEGGGFETFWS